MSLSDLFSAVMTLRRVLLIIPVVAGAGYKLAPVVWHKSAPKPALVSAACAASAAQIALLPGKKTVAVETALHELGDISLTNHYETLVQLGGGKDCILSPKMIDSRNVQITFALKCKTNTGKIHELLVAQVVTRTGKSVEVALGDLNLSLTPQMAAE